jgi:hypothetical protein
VSRGELRGIFTHTHTHTHTHKQIASYWYSVPSHTIRHGFTLF